MFPISSIQLQFGVPGGEALKIPDPAVTVFVGPNNSGKSLVLRELWQTARSGRSSGQILRDVTYADLTGRLGQAIIERVLREAKVPSEIDEETVFKILCEGTHLNISKSTLRNFLGQPENAGSDFLPIILPAIVLDGAARLQLVQSRPVESLAAPQNSFERLVVDDGARSRLQGILYEAFVKHLVVDASSRPGHASLRYSSTAPGAGIERSFSEEAIRFFQSATPIEGMSDGVRAFTGILVELLAGDPLVLVIDEPEAFLHPSLAFLLGREVSKPSPGSIQKNVFVATHSASFLMGCVQSGASVNVVRLTHSEGRSTARLLDAQRLRAFMRNPLLRSVGAMEALFYDYVVVTEADGDRAFYDEINHRMVMSGDARGIPNCLFLRAQNKQTVGDIVRPLRALGIPAAGIVDVDIYEEGGKVWSNFVSAAGMDDITMAGTATVRAAVKAAFDKSGVAKPKLHGGINILAPGDRRAAENLFDQLDEHGMFAVRHGEVEHWLPELVQEKLHGPDWLVRALENMGDEPTAAEYLRPGAGDVWDFVGGVGQWLRSPSRKGL